MLCQQRGFAPKAASRGPCVAPRRVVRSSRPLNVVARADDRGSDGFVTGFVLGGAIFGALGFLLAPQISKALLDDDQRLKMPKFLEEEKDPQQTKQELIEKINRLNASMDEVASKLSSAEVV